MPYQLANVDDEYSKDSNLKREDVKVLLEWTEKQPHLPKITEFQALQFLQSCYYRMEFAKTALDNYFTIRTLCPEIFTYSLDDPALKLTMDITLMAPLPKRPPNNYKVLFARLLDFNPDSYIYNYQVKMLDMIGTLDLNLTGTSPGYYMIIDMTGGTLTHITKINLTTAKKYTYYLQEALPVRLKGVHLINVVPFVDRILAIFKPFMKKELQEMIHIHRDNLESLYKFIPKECLPSDLGGSSPSFKQLQAETNQRIIDNFDFFVDLQQYRVDETKRPGKPKNVNEMFGVDGTFKKLDID